MRILHGLKVAIYLTNLLLSLQYIAKKRKTLSSTETVSGQVSSKGSAPPEGAARKETDTHQEKIDRSTGTSSPQQASKGVHFADGIPVNAEDQENHSEKKKLSKKKKKKSRT